MSELELARTRAREELFRWTVSHVDISLRRHGHKPEIPAADSEHARFSCACGLDVFVTVQPDRVMILGSWDECPLGGAS